MNRIQLVFPNAANAWDFITQTKISNVEVEEAILTGFFTDSDVKLARSDFDARVQEPPPQAPQPAPQAQKATEPGLSQALAQDVELAGKSGATYAGTLYSKADKPVALPPYAILCLSNSMSLNGGWQHSIQSVFYTDKVKQEVGRWQLRDDIAHLIVIPVGKGETKGVDDLIRRYVHR